MFKNSSGKKSQSPKSKNTMEGVESHRPTSRPSSKLMSFLPPNQQQQTSTLTKSEAKHGLLSLAESVLTGATSPSAYNRHEPLVAQSETNIDNEFRASGVGLGVDSETNSNKQRNSVLYNASETAATDSARIKFSNHLDQCNSSLAKLVNMMNRK